MAIRNGISPRSRKNDITRGRARNVISLPSSVEEHLETPPIIKHRREMTRRSIKQQQIELPSPADEGSIEQTTIYPTIDAIWLEAIVDKPWFDASSFEAKQILKHVLYTAVSETLRTVAFRINADQDTRIFDELGKEILAYDRTLQAYAAGLNANAH